MKRFPPVAELVPHTPPTLALEELVEWTPEHARARMTVRPTGIFVRAGALDAVYTLEFMAQTVAACLGMRAFQAGDDVRVGMVVSCRRLALERARLFVGETLVLGARELRSNESTSLFETDAHDGDGKLVAHATMTLVHRAAQ